MENSTFILVMTAIYMLVLIGAGFVGKKRAKNVNDFLVCGRNLGVFMTANTIAATQIGAGVIVGGASTGGQLGVWPGMYYALGCGLGCIVAGIFIAGKMRAANAIVPMDYFEKRFGTNPVIRGWAWLSNVPSLLGIFVAQLLACGSILAAFGIPFWVGVVVCAAITLIYSSMGGMWSVAIGDSIQLIIIVIFIPVAAIFALGALGDTGVSASAIFATPFIPQGLFTKLVYMVSPMLVSIAVSYDSFMRYQSARSVETAKWGCIIGGIITIIIGTFASTVGAAGHQLFPDAEGIFAYTIAQTSPLVIAALVIVAVLAAAMSSANGLLICMSASFSKDLYNGIFHPDKKLEELPQAKNIARWTIIIGCIVGALITFKLTNILDAIILFNYPYMGSMLVPLYAALLSKNATRRGCYVAMVFGAVIGVVCFLGGLGILPVNADMGLFAAYIVSAVVMFAVSASDRANKVPMVEQDF
jgi:SSS family solute:Na+ symporter